MRQGGTSWGSARQVMPLRTPSSTALMISRRETVAGRPGVGLGDLGCDPAPLGIGEVGGVSYP